MFLWIKKWGMDTEQPKQVILSFNNHSKERSGFIGYHMGTYYSSLLGKYCVSEREARR
ncbi:hypothetical protein GCM10007199_14080 [Fictibacillus barbaricus]|nr:hypothetical protein GCM10007199_14080 [Fictibacillus barbaricus]